MIAYRTVHVDGLKIFYREAGRPGAPTIVLLHGFPSSSHMFRNLMTELAEDFHLIAPDYPGFGNSDNPSVHDFEYSFERLADLMEKFLAALGIEQFIPYVMDYGAPIGFRIAERHPERIRALIVQNGNAYEEGLPKFWEPIRAFWQDKNETTGEALRFLLTRGATEWQYFNGARNPQHVSLDAVNADQATLERPGNQDIQLALFYDYRTNPPLYPRWQEYFRRHQPPTLVVWGKNDEIFSQPGALAFQRDLKDTEIHLLNTGHFALEEESALIAELIRRFLATRRPRG
ncbi:alpha/beta fold hydrolase [Gloeobacter morelensis]|uniref:Alpha/beta hydrolase n=1 Tax=Gloeobacter morelensis MG652769 TaxID=2781736 RepID=A0ABY3PQD4_9CYAN|nr:alpha/beta hydrolase [Gloeobacter morelensis]UFP95896.1 alpha/beta hydrolase [Gloeobacter morelensis MG652769]